MAAVEVVIVRLDALVARRIADSFVQREDEQRVLAGGKRLGEGQRARHRPRGRQVHDDLRPIGLQTDLGGQAQQGSRIQQ